MKLVSFGKKGPEKPGVVVGQKIIDLTLVDPSLPRSVRGIIETGVLGRVREILNDEASLPDEKKVGFESVRLGPPITDPTKIICIGLNYRDHAEEQGKDVPESPLLFSKGPNALVGYGAAVPYPRCVEKLDYEIEMAFVMGKRAKHVPVEGAYDYVAGYGVFMDLSARDLQRHERQWFRGKSFDAAAPFGPWLVTADEIDDPHDLNISIDVNGETLQSSNTGEMFFKVDYLIHYISQTMTLEPGDIVATGTPSGVGVFRKPPRFLSRGDCLEGKIDSLGTLTCTIE